MADASRQGRVLVASVGGEPKLAIRQPSSCSPSRGLSQPPPSREAAIRASAEPAEGRCGHARRLSREAREAALVAARFHQEEAIGRFQVTLLVVRVAAVSRAPRTHSPNHFGLRRHLEADARQSASLEEPTRATTRCRVLRR